MPNIEIHGMGSIFEVEDTLLFRLQHQALLNTVKKIKDVIFASEFKDKVVITAFDSFCIDVEHTSQPFLRIYDTNIQEADKIAQMLHDLRLGFDIEIVGVEKFIPK
ncbi:MAG: hypothetical protein M1170_02920 [Patescibacteria group bacterium]|nr:hypothetical protein [Patescibacteria group bacterium]